MQHKEDVLVALHGPVTQWRVPEEPAPAQAAAAVAAHGGANASSGSSECWATIAWPFLLLVAKRVLEEVVDDAVPRECRQAVLATVERPHSTCCLAASKHPASGDEIVDRIADAVVQRVASCHPLGSGLLKQKEKRAPTSGPGTCADCGSSECKRKSRSQPRGFRCW